MLCCASKFVLVANPKAYSLVLGELSYVILLHKAKIFSENFLSICSTNFDFDCRLDQLFVMSKVKRFQERECMSKPPRWSELKKFSVDELRDKHLLSFRVQIQK